MTRLPNHHLHFFFSHFSYFVSHCSVLFVYCFLGRFTINARRFTMCTSKYLFWFHFDMQQFLKLNFPSVNFRVNKIKCNDSCARLWKIITILIGWFLCLRGLCAKQMKRRLQTVHASLYFRGSNTLQNNIEKTTAKICTLKICMFRWKWWIVRVCGAVHKPSTIFFKWNMK